MPSSPRKVTWLALILWCSPSVSALPPQKAGEVKVEQAVLSGEDASIPYEVGTLYAPENRTDPESRLIGVGFARFQAVEQPRKAPPIFLLPGGPGGSYVSRLATATGRRKKWIASTIARYTKVSDLILVDQRGFSSRGDTHRGVVGMPPRPKDRPPSQADTVRAFEAFARKTVERYAKKGVDLAGYNVKECAHDVEDLRKALGYEQITLCGTSFGSQWSFAVMRLHPDSVARALLSGVEPLNHGYDMPSHVFAAVQRMWKTIDEDPRFEPYLPDGGMAEAAQVVIERLEQAPMKIVDTSGAGEDAPVGFLGPGDFPWQDPTQILELYHERLDRWRKKAWAPGGVRFINLIGPLIDTSLGVTAERRHQLWTDPATRYLGRGNFAAYLATADIWPSPDVGDDFRTPVLCKIPVVFAQGDWDTKTPIENTFEIAPFFVNSRVLIARRGGHGVLDPIAGELPRAWTSLDRFLRTGDMSEVPARVVLAPSRVFEPPKFPPPGR